MLLVCNSRALNPVTDSFCAAPLALPHQAVKETEVRGYTVPADTIVLANINGIHHDPAVWPDPYLFNPGRFLDKGGHFCPPKENFVPFSLGESDAGVRHVRLVVCLSGVCPSVVSGSVSQTICFSLFS